MMCGEMRFVSQEQKVTCFRDENYSFKCGPQMVPVMVAASTLVSPCGLEGRLYHLMAQNYMGARHIYQEAWALAKVRQSGG